MSRSEFAPAHPLQFQRGEGKVRTKKARRKTRPRIKQMGLAAVHLASAVARRVRIGPTRRRRCVEQSGQERAAMGSGVKPGSSR